MADNGKAAFLWAEGQQESGGNYKDVNPQSGALGKYQVMPSNLPAWTKSALGHSLTAQQFLSNPAAQEAVANKILGGYYDKYGAAGAAAMWYSGQPDPTKKYGSPPVFKYVEQVLARMKNASPASGTTPVTGSDASFHIPGVGDVPDLNDIGGSLAKGLENGIILAFKSVVGPILKWAWWVLETGLGFSVLVGGAFLVAQKSDMVKTVEKAVLSTAAPEAAPAIESASKKPEKTFNERQNERLARKEKSAAQRVENARVDDMLRRMKEGRGNE